MARRVKWRNIGICVLVVVAVGFFIYVAIVNSGKDEDKTCRDIKVEIADANELSFVSDSDVVSLIKKRYPKLIGQKKKNIDIKAIEVLLMKDSVIRRAECYYLPGGDLGVKIWQRLPVMRILGDNSYYVDNEGKIFPLSENYNAYVPIVTGHIDKKFVTTELKDFMVYVSRDEFWSAEIQQIVISDDNKLTIIPTLGDHKIVFGTVEGYEEKLQRLKTFYVKGLSKIGWGDYSAVNVEFAKQVICTKKNSEE